MKVWTERIEGIGANGEENEQTVKASYTAYLIDNNPEEAEKKRKAIIICPGGGYRFVSPREAEPIALEYLAMGYHAFVLSYSVAPSRFPQAIEELAWLTVHIRRHAEEWKIQEDGIVVSGFSAGGHLAGSLGAFWNQEWLAQAVGAENEEIRPNGMILCYPVVTAGEYCHRGSVENLLGDRADEKEAQDQFSLEFQVGAHTPKTFLWHTVTDQTVPVQNSLLLANALVQSGVNLEMHLYPVGCHGLSLATEETAVGQENRVEPQCQNWIELAGNWMSHL
ncbi:alpha/beta hydrolase [Brotaphodocola catenula]|uniref:Alpha/beta hydrolase n=1 Tax=Brotaphodocola catenula TaxID=2885361 RepID=A0AAE3AUS7_9FIRM|nr:alpha/beta hydrolase [Brotaphodocola catenula]MCC2165890.1 alpha/beta hydrolase [Brotaphodocola catenula]